MPPIYIVTAGSKLRHNGKPYTEHDTVGMEEAQGKPLVDLGVIVKAPEDKPVKTPAGKRTQPSAERTDGSNGDDAAESAPALSAAESLDSTAEVNTQQDGANAAPAGGAETAAGTTGSAARAPAKKPASKSAKGKKK